MRTARAQTRRALIDKALLPLRQGEMTLAQVTAALGPKRGKPIQTEADLITYLMKVRRPQLGVVMAANEEAYKKTKKGSDS